MSPQPTNQGTKPAAVEWTEPISAAVNYQTNPIQSTGGVESHLLLLGTELEITLGLSKPHFLLICCITAKRMPPCVYSPSDSLYTISSRYMNSVASLFNKCCVADPGCERLRGQHRLASAAGWRRVWDTCPLHAGEKGKAHGADQ